MRTTTGREVRPKKEEETEDFPSFERHTTLIKFGLSVIGVWPLDPDAPTWRVTVRRVHVTLVYALMLSLLVPQLLDLCVLWGDIEANAENLCTTLTTMTTLAKLSNVIVARRPFETILETMRIDWQATMKSSVPREHRELLLREAKVARRFTRIYCTVMYATEIMYVILPLIIGLDAETSHAKQYPFCAWYYYDEFSDVHYGFFYFMQASVGALIATGNYVFDSLCLVMVSHTCGQFRILQSEIRRIGEEGDGVASNEEVVARVKMLVRKHQELMRNARNLEALFSGASVQQLLVSSVIICVIGFKLIVSLNDNVYRLLMYAVYMYLVLFQLFLYCWPGNELIRQSLKVGYATFQCRWTDFSVSVSRCLLLMNLRAQKPVTIRAGKFFVMSLPAFSAILKTSLSYLSVLRAMYDE